VEHLQIFFTSYPTNISYVLWAYLRNAKHLHLKLNKQTAIMTEWLLKVMPELGVFQSLHNKRLLMVLCLASFFIIIWMKAIMSEVIWIKFD